MNTRACCDWLAVIRRLGKGCLRYLFYRFLFVLLLLLFWFGSFSETGLEGLTAAAAAAAPAAAVCDRGSSLFPGEQPAANSGPRQTDQQQKTRRGRGQDDPRRVQLGLQTQVNPESSPNISLSRRQQLLQVAGKQLGFLQRKTSQVSSHLSKLRIH